MQWPCLWKYVSHISVTVTCSGYLIYIEKKFYTTVSGVLVPDGVGLTVFPSVVRRCSMTGALSIGDLVTPQPGSKREKEHAAP